MKKFLFLFIGLLPAGLLAQDSYYYHTIHSSALAATYGRTYKGHYAYQLSRLRQVKLSGIYVFDEYTQSDGNRIKADVYNLGLQFQYNVIHLGNLFLSVNLGAGVYQIKAGDLIGIKFKETKVNFLGGAQLEYYLRKNRLALLVDYDALYFPFSKLYEVLHVPTAGLGIFF
ncbi:MAG: hypothetical protein ONB46_01585 [candidate division KSB1 bacterium]|nr:hypothetical protein [candidate division KSB1 bacterium]MDZ7364358.1 hypothetical protein [candidate division KSB1 bacterium]MDZ7402730.1 hypothetical protein [candidate division KSB1 bacterium]